MEESTNLTGILVALMFVTIVTMAVGNLLTFLSERLQARDAARRDPLRLTWVGLLLLMSLNAFWQCVLILDVQTWVFTEFLFVILGACALFFASTSVPRFVEGGDPEDREDAMHRRTVFFALIAGFMLWLVALDMIFGIDSLALVVVQLGAAIVAGAMALGASIARPLPATLAFAALQFVSMGLSATL